MQETLRYLTAQLKRYKNYEIKADALQKIASLQDPQATEFLINLLNETQANSSNMVRILCVLPETNDPRVADIIWKHASEDFPPAMPIMELLGNTREKRAIPLLIKALNTKALYAGERITAAIALGKIGDERAVPALVNALGEDRTFVGFERVWIPKNIALSQYALQALKLINTDIAKSAIQTWEAKYDERAQVRAEKFIKLVEDNNYVRWQHNEDLLRLGYHAIDVVNTISLHQGKTFKRAINQIFMGLAKYPEMIPQSAEVRILDFVLTEFERSEHSIFSPSFFDVIAHFDNPKIDDYALKMIDYYADEWRQIQLLNLLAKRRVPEAISIIERLLQGSSLLANKPIVLFKALAEIGGADCKQIIEHYLPLEDSTLRIEFLEAYTELYRGTDHALHLIDPLINHNNTRIQVRAINALSKGADGALYILISLLSSNKIQRSAALNALGRFGDERALPYIIAQISGTRLNRDIRKTLEAIATENAYAILNAWDAPDNDFPLAQD